MQIAKNQQRPSITNLTPPLDLERWQRANHMPFVDGDHAIDAPEWMQTHDIPHAFEVVPELCWTKTSGV